MANIHELKPVHGLKGFKHFCCTIGELPSSYLESWTYYEMLNWFCNYLLNTVIPTVNNNAESVLELQNLYVQLKNYVDNYFENLDVQEEINNKLDEMVEDGTLQNLLLDYANIIKIVSTCEELKTLENLYIGNIIETLGYYNINDGGQAQYIIRDEIPTGKIYETLENNLYAELLIINDIINIKQLGAKSTDSTLVKNDIKPYINKYLTARNYNINLKLYIPSGGYYSSKINLAGVNGFYIYGDENFTTDIIKGTIISSIEDNQDFIFNIGNENEYTFNWVLKNIYCTSADYKYSNNLIKLDNTNIKKIDYAINLLYAITGITDNLFFGMIHGGALQLCSSWENYFPVLNFRYMYNITKNIVNFKRVNVNLLPQANITANKFETINIESVFAYRIFNFEYLSGAVNNTFGDINFEETWININNLDITKVPITDEILEEWDDNAFNVYHMSIFGGYRCSAIINSINCDVIGNSYLLYNDNSIKYIYDTIFTHDINLGGMNVIVNSIEIDNCKNTIKLYRLKTYTTDLYCKNIINSLINKGSNDCIYDVDGMQYLECNSPIIKAGNNQLNLLKLQNEVTPAYKLTNIYGGGDYGLLYSNQDADNDLKLCVKPFPNNANVNSITFLKTSNELHINALIPLNDVVKIVLVSGSTLQAYELTGTGNFNEYTIEYTSQLINSGHKDIGLRISGSSTSKNILIDYLY